MTDDQTQLPTLDPLLLSVLGCPACETRSALTLRPGGLYCAQCGRTYPIHDGIPDLLVEDAAMAATED